MIVFHLHVAAYDTNNPLAAKLIEPSQTLPFVGCWRWPQNSAADYSISESHPLKIAAF
jgi:hypothetical protein